MTRGAAAIVLALCAGLAARPGAQTPSSKPAFEVASIKMNKAGGGKGSSTSVGTGDVLRPQGDRLLTRNATLRTIIRYAYGEPNGDQDFVVSLEPGRVIGGPPWIGSDAFDIDAKLPARPTTPRERTLMMRTLLEDRFALKVHLEQRNMPIYALVRARSNGALGEQLRPRTDKCVQSTNGSAEPVQCGVRFRPGYVFGNGVFMAGVAQYLYQVVDRVVVDRTELPGRFDFEVKYAEAPGIGQAVDRSASSNPDAPSIFVAVQEQLGLKLEPTRAPVDVVVIDSVRRPSAN